MLKPSYFLFALFFLFLLSARTLTAAAKCPVCGMQIKTESKVTFQFTQKDTKTEVCSFVCASRFLKRHSDSTLFVKDFPSAEPVDAKKAFFLVKSKNAHKEVETQMLPCVIGFKTEQAALEFKKHIGDGEVVQGFDAALRIYE